MNKGTFKISKSRQYYWFYCRMKSGIKSIKKNSTGQKIMFAYLIIVAVTWFNKYSFWEENMEYPFEKILFNMKLIILYAGSLIAILLYYSKAIKEYFLKKEFLRIRMVNHLGETPILLDYIEHDGIVRAEFDSAGIPITIWEDRVAELQNALNVTISKLELKGNNRVVVLRGCKGIIDYSKDIIWKNEYQSYDGNLRIGESIGEAIYMDLSKHAHVLIGGATGSGKTWLMKLILMQCINKNCDITIADFKGGIDYPDIWHEKCKIVIDENATLSELKKICEEIEIRKKGFKETNSKDLAMFRKNTSEILPRIIFACDEIAELLDLSGLDKNQKEQRKQIAGYINTIARQGRAFGINLVLATQRPDADVLSGQTKNNITYRVCGRADDVLSRIILDTTDASDKVPKDAEGVFLNQDGIVFKSYVFDEEKNILV